jgi:hypothetical protein
MLFYCRKPLFGQVDGWVPLEFEPDQIPKLILLRLARHFGTDAFESEGFQESVLGRAETMIFFIRQPK